MNESTPDHPLPCLNEQTPQANYAVCWFSLVMIVCSMAAVTARMVDGKPLRSANDRSRWCTVWSLVERGTYQIDEVRQKPGWDSIDIVKHNDHFYSTKPPLMPRMVAEVYRGVKAVTGYTLDKETGPATWIILFIVNIIPAGIALWVLCSLIRRYCTDTFGQCFLICVACWGALYLPFLTVLNNHTVAITSIIIAIGLAVNIVIEDKQEWWRYALCGLFAAFGCCNELPAAAFGVAFFLLLFKKNAKLTWLFFVTASLIPLIAFFITNYQATGGWKPFYMFYGTEKYLFTHNGVPSYWMEPKGVDKARDTFAQYFLHCTIGHHGIFSLSPIYLITLIGWGMACFQKTALRVFSLMGLVLSIIVLAFYLSKTENYNYGGVSIALRWTLWLSPFWILSMIPVMNCCGRSKFLRTVCLACLSVSVFSAWYPANSPWTQPWLYKLMEHAEWIDYSDPRPQFERKHSSWIGDLPTGELDEDYWISFAAFDANAPTESITLKDDGVNVEGFRNIRIERPLDGSQQSLAYTIDPKAFLAGKAPETFVLGSLTEQELQFFQGMPNFRLYGSSRIRYVKTGLRKDAFKCHVGYSYITVKDESGMSLQYIRDVWYCDEVPFGVLQWQDRVVDAKSKTELAKRLWMATEYGKTLESARKP